MKKLGICMILLISVISSSLYAADSKVCKGHKGKANGELTLRIESENFSDDPSLNAFTSTASLLVGSATLTGDEFESQYDNDLYFQSETINLSNDVASFKGQLITLAGESLKGKVILSGVLSICDSKSKNCSDKVVSSELTCVQEK